MLDLIIYNKEWLFSGLGIAVISAIFAIMKKVKRPKDDGNNFNVAEIKM